MIVAFEATLDSPEKGASKERAMSFRGEGVTRSTNSAGTTVSRSRSGMICDLEIGPLNGGLPSSLLS